MTTYGVKVLRISDDREGMEAGVTRQDEDLDALGVQHGITWVAKFVDNDIGASTRSRKPRPDYTDMIKRARAGEFDDHVVAAYSSSRLTRRPREHEDLIELAERHGVRFLYVRSPSFNLNTAAGRQIARILAAQDAAVAEQTGELVARAARQRAESGQPHGGARRYGFAPDGITVVEPEAAIVKELTRRVIAGESTRGLARDLRDRGVPTGRGGTWSARVVKEIVCRPRNAGLRVHDEGTPTEKVFPAAWESIVDRDEWTAARALLLDPDRGTWHGQTPASLLAGIAVCHCGGRIRSGAHDTYVGAECHHVKRSRAVTDAVVDGYVLAVLERENVKVPTVKAPRKMVDNAARILVVRRQIERLEDRLADEDLTPAAYRRQRERKQTQLLALEAAQVRTARPDAMAGVTVATWPSLPLERRRGAVAFLAAVVLVRKGDPDSHDGMQIIPKRRTS
jgi:site-specific DNA recombinase